MQDFDMTISDIVRTDYRTADVFKSFGINYCCSGKVFLHDVCETNKLDEQVVVAELKKATRDVIISNTVLFETWEINFLIDYIVNLHHAYVKIAIPNIQTSLSSYLYTHKNNQVLRQVEEVFDQLSKVILTQSVYEEEIIFPYIKHLEVTHRRKEVYGSLFVRTLRKPLENIEVEHKKITDLLIKVRELTNNYTVELTTCTNQRVIIDKLQAFDNDLVQHKHLENNILFPKAILLEKELLQSQMH